MVTTGFRSTLETGVRQARVGAPSTCTVQAPHCPTPQPNLVPTSPRLSRKIHSSGVSGAASTARGWPLMLMVYLLMANACGEEGRRAASSDQDMQTERENLLEAQWGSVLDEARNT